MQFVFKHTNVGNKKNHKEYTDAKTVYRHVRCRLCSKGGIPVLYVMAV